MGSLCSMERAWGRGKSRNLLNLVCWGGKSDQLPAESLMSSPIRSHLGLGIKPFGQMEENTFFCRLAQSFHLARYSALK